MTSEEYAESVREFNKAGKKLAEKMLSLGIKEETKQWTINNLKLLLDFETKTGVKKEIEPSEINLTLSLIENNDWRKAVMENQDLYI